MVRDGLGNLFGKLKPSKNFWDTPPEFSESLGFKRSFFESKKFSNLENNCNFLKNLLIKL